MDTFNRKTVDTWEVPVFLTLKSLSWRTFEEEFYWAESGCGNTAACHEYRGPPAVRN